MREWPYGGLLTLKAAMTALEATGLDWAAIGFIAGSEDAPWQWEYRSEKQDRDSITMPSAKQYGWSVGHDLSCCSRREN
jgi:hypothetical protein